MYIKQINQTSQIWGTPVWLLNSPVSKSLSTILDECLNDYFGETKQPIEYQDTTRACMVGKYFDQGQEVLFTAIRSLGQGEVTLYSPKPLVGRGLPKPLRERLTQPFGFVLRDQQTLIIPGFLRFDLNVTYGVVQRCDREVVDATY